MKSDPSLALSLLALLPAGAVPFLGLWPLAVSGLILLLIVFHCLYSFKRTSS